MPDVQNERPSGNDEDDDGDLGDVFDWYQHDNHDRNQDHDLILLTLRYGHALWSLFIKVMQLY